MSQEQTDQNVQDAFNKALEKSKKERKERESQRMNGGSSGGGLDVIEWFGLEDQVEKVFRIFGMPIEFRKSGTDPKLFYHSKFINDKKDGYVNIIWDQTSDGLINEDWLLHQLITFTRKKHWVKFENGQKNEKGHDGEFKYLYENSETFKRLNSNLKKNVSSNFFAPKISPKTRIAMNIIDRHDNWCLENNHSKILSSKGSYWKDNDNGDPIIFWDLGIPEMLYNKILDDVVSFRHHWFLDIVVKKNKNDLNNAYIVRDILEDKLNEETKSLGFSESLTEEEKNIELYDFDKMRTFKITSYLSLYKKLVGLFKMFDAEFNQNFTEQLEKKVEEEQLKKNEEEVNDILDEVDESVEEQKENSTESITVQESVVEKREIRKQSDDEMDYTQFFPEWNKLSDIEKEQMKINIESFDGNVPQYKNSKETAPCIDPNCKYKYSELSTFFPLTVRTCPVCGKVDTSSDS